MVRVWNTEGGNEVERKRQPITTGLKVFNWSSNHEISSVEQYVMISSTHMH